MSERNAAAAYVALKKESVKGTAVIPDTYTSIYRQSLNTDINLIDDKPIYGNKFARLQSLQGIRKHQGSLSVMGEPNTLARFFDMLMQKGSTTGSGPYTHPFTHGTTDPNSYTVDISYVSYVQRFMGVEASKITIGWDGEKMVPEIDVSGLASFTGAEIASISTTTVTLKTDKDPTPTNGLVASDTVKIVKSDGTSTNFTISSLTATTVTLSATAAAFAAGDMLVIRPATPALTLLTPFVWGNTHYFFAADAATAFSNSSTLSNQTRLEPGTEMTMMHGFNDEAGEKRSGAFDPASLIRTTYDATFKAKLFVDNPSKLKEWNAISKQAIVMRAYTGSSNQYELRVTLNNLRVKTNEMPFESEQVMYHDYEFSVDYDTTDGQAFDAKLLNAVSTI
jgi:hypothetical protein